jgi:hypothetical protein
MRVDYKRCPTLEKLQKGSLGKLGIFQPDAPFFSLMLDLFNTEWKQNNEAFKTEINVITRPFAEACYKSQDRLIELYRHILVDNVSDFSFSGTYLLGDFVYMINYETKKGDENVDQAFYIFSMDGTPLAMWNMTRNTQEVLWISQYFKVTPNENPIRQWFAGQLGKIIVLKMFKSYATVETRILKPSQRVKDISCMYRNDTKLDLTFLDCKWFTNLVKSEGFNVRGHFRLQPKKKDGEWTKELIWISEFQKTGYTAPARMLSQNAT